MIQKANEYTSLTTPGPEGRWVEAGGKRQEVKRRGGRKMGEGVQGEEEPQKTLKGDIPIMSRT